MPFLFGATFFNGGSHGIFFEDLKAYKAAISWNDYISQILDNLGTHCSRTIRDQLERASLSIPLNIAEGNGRWHKAEKRQFFWIARGSTFECVAILQVIARRGLLQDRIVGDLYDQLAEISKMLSALIKSVDPLKDAEIIPSALHVHSPPQKLSSKV
jgi:four helix bundle protein